MNIENYSGIDLYMNQIEKVPLLTKDEEFDLGVKASSGDWHAVDILIKSNLRLVVKIAHEFKGYGVPIGDLISEGNIGLMTAAKKFDPRKGAKFSSYSALWIKQSIRNTLAKMGRTVRIPINTLSKLSKVHMAIKLWKEKHNRSPEDEELASYLKLPLVTIKKLLKLNTKTVSLNQKAQGKESSSELYEFVPDRSQHSVLEHMEFSESLMMMNQHFSVLRDREKYILNLRYGLDGKGVRTLEEVSQMMKITRERVRQIQMVALNKLKKHLKNNGALS